MPNADAIPSNPTIPNVDADVPNIDVVPLNPSLRRS